AAEHLPCIAANVCCYFTCIALRHANLLRCRAAFIHQRAVSPVQKLCLGDLGDHFGEFLLLQLERSDRLAKLLALLAVPESCVVAIHRRANRSPRDSIPRLGATSEWALQSPDVWKYIFFWNF